MGDKVIVIQELQDDPEGKLINNTKAFEVPFTKELSEGFILDY